MKITATVTDCVQVGVDAFRDIHTSRVFDTSRPIDDVLRWAALTLKKHTVGINEIQFSEHTGESV